MLEQARAVVPRARFIQGDAGRWLPDGEVDLVFANAVYQWVPDHLAMLSRVMAALHPGGVLAVQMPDNVAEPTHRLMEQVALDARWAPRLSNAGRPALPPPRVYYDTLRPHASRVDIWHTIYNHLLDGPDAIVDWVRATGLRPFLDPLSAEERLEFLRLYRDRVAQAYPPSVDGRVLLRFPRLFVVAVR
jgi:trans-aconitate 2-methyltransferase